MIRDNLRERLPVTQKNVECGFRGSNTRPLDLQSNALPTELKPLQRPYANPVFLALYSAQRSMFAMVCEAH